MAGPMWGKAIHDRNFIQGMLDLLQSESVKYGTQSRMRGMLEVAFQVSPMPNILEVYILSERLLIHLQ